MEAVENEGIGWGELLRGRHAAAVLLCCLGVWLHAADALVVTTMLPAIVADIGGHRIGFRLVGHVGLRRSVLRHG